MKIIPKALFFWRCRSIRDLSSVRKHIVPAGRWWRTNANADTSCADTCWYNDANRHQLGSASGDTFCDSFEVLSGERQALGL
jgi:hypothetical protein